MKSKLHEREDVPILENVGEFTLILYQYEPFDAKFYAYFEFEVKILFPPTHFRENFAPKRFG